MVYQPIEDYGIIGDLYTVALVGKMALSTGAASPILTRRVFLRPSSMIKRAAPSK